MKIKNMNIIALDIDDCILPTNVNYFGMTDDADMMLEINLKRLAMILEKYDMKVFITSAWYAILKFVDGELSMKYPKEHSERNEYKQFDLIKKYIGDNIVGLSCGNREKDIKELSVDNKVVIIDDMDLKHLENENCLFCEVKGFINGNVGYKIRNFFK